MLAKIGLLFRTVRYLKLTQIVYQVRYRLSRKKNLRRYERITSLESLQLLNFLSPPVGRKRVTNDNTFIFLNLSQRFSGKINWTFSEYGKLWNYNLQYLDYIHQEDISEELKVDWVRDLFKWLHAGKLPLEPYPVSLRSMNLIRFLSQRPERAKEYPGLCKAIHAELDFLNSHLEYHLLGNHLLENAFALFMGGYFFDENEWKRGGRRLLKTQLDEQVLSDGGHFELSPMYHQIILHRLLELIGWYSQASRCDEAFLKYLKGKATCMLSWLKRMTFSNGDIPHLNDSARGISPSTAELVELAEKVGISTTEACRLSESGYRKYEFGDYECIVDAGQVGPSYQPGHAHADALSFLVHYKAEPLLVEVGTSTYQIGDIRNYERSTRAHNTVVVGGKNQSEVWGGFRVGKRANVTIIDETENTICATHDGYLRNLGVTHIRNFEFSPDFFFIKDQIKSSNKVDSIAYFHCHPDRHVELYSDSLVRIDGSIELAFKNHQELRLSDFHFAEEFNLFREGKVVMVNFREELETKVLFKK